MASLLSGVPLWRSLFRSRRGVEMEQVQESPVLPATSTPRLRQVLNAGSGPRTARQLHAGFKGLMWRETRIDIDPAAEPDIVGSIAEMTDTVADQGFDAVWCSH